MLAAKEAGSQFSKSHEACKESRKHANKPRNELAKARKACKGIKKEVNNCNRCVTKETRMQQTKGNNKCKHESR